MGIALLGLDKYTIICELLYSLVCRQGIEAGYSTVQIIGALVEYAAVLTVARKYGNDLTDLCKYLILCAIEVYETILLALCSLCDRVVLVPKNGIRSIDICLCALCHQHVIGKTGENRKSATTVSEDGCDLWDLATGERLLLVDTAETEKCVVCLLETYAGAIEKSDDRSLILHGHRIDAGDLSRMHLTDRTTQNCSVLCIYIHEVAVDGSITGNNTVRWCLLLSHVKVC